MRKNKKTIITHGKFDLFHILAIVENCKGKLEFLKECCEISTNIKKLLNVISVSKKDLPQTLEILSK